MPVAGYSHGHDESVLKGHKWRTIDNSAAYLKPHLNAQTKLLDLGCGPGTITNDFADICGSVIGTDLSEEVLQDAKIQAETRGLKNVTYQTADATKLPFADGEFDVVHCHQVLQHVQKPIEMLKEMRRVTKKAGIVAARESDYASFCFFEETQEIRDWRDLTDKVFRANGGEPNAGRMLVYWATLAGFDKQSVKCSASAWIYKEPNELKVWGHQWADRILKSNMAKDAIKHKLATQEDLERISQGWLDWAADPKSFGSVLSFEVLCTV